MTSEEAKKCIIAGTAKERLQAARFFSQNPTEVSTELLREALAQEGVSWIKKALALALERADVSVIRPADVNYSSEGEVNSRLIRSVMARATEEVTGTILHEFSTIIGEINMKAMSEFDDFAGSQTFKLMSRLKEILRAVRELKRASASPDYSDFNLGELIDQIIEENPKIFDGITLNEAGQRPFIVSADRGSMFLAIINGLRNASEALLEFSRKTPPEVLLTWGRAGDEVFFAIIDSGSGFKGNPNNALKIGVTNKDKNIHTGYGLATASSAMKAMEGELLLSNSLDGGARFELRWYKENETSTG